jgi:hypothetical protein
MDTETAAAIERVNTRIDALEVTLRGEFRHGLDEIRDELRDEFRAELSAQLAEVRRHAVMLNESTRDDIRLVAEAVAVLAVKVDSLRR